MITLNYLANVTWLVGQKSGDLPVTALPLWCVFSDRSCLPNWANHWQM